ncbi:hypothetical protein V8E36_008860 [Tilletia maclaganii]
MTAFANLERSNTIIDLLQGPRSATPIQLKAGVVQSIESINKKLPALLPMLVMSEKVEERGLHPRCLPRLDQPGRHYGPRLPYARLAAD